MAEVNKKAVISEFVRAMENSGMDLTGLCELCKNHISCGKECPYFYAGEVEGGNGAAFACWDWACNNPACKDCENSNNFEWKEGGSNGES